MLILKNEKLKFREDPGDPWVARMHHVDKYPESDFNQAVKKEDLKGHNIGEDIDENLDFRMYYGKKVPGFPMHSHRGFETITVLLDGTIDHFDSVGNHGRYQAGDVQWMTAGKGIRHSEMFPLLNDNSANNLELFQIWLSLPSYNKMADADYKMFWREDINHFIDEGIDVSVITGEFKNIKGNIAPKASWAYEKKSNTRILYINLKKNKELEINGVSKTLNRNLYLTKGQIKIEDEDIIAKRSLKLNGNEDFVIKALEDSTMLLLESEPIGEKIINDGPMVMNTEKEVLEGYRDYWRTHYGDWNWDRTDPVHKKNTKRISKKN